MPTAEAFDNISEIVSDNPQDKVLSAETVDAIKDGKSFTVTTSDSDKVITSWTFKGSDSKLGGYARGKVDTTITPFVDESKKQITLQFAYDGTLPYESDIRHFVGVEHAGEKYQVKNSGDATPIGEYAVDAQGYIEFTITHCSDWVMTQYFTVTYNANGGTYEDGSQQAESGGAYLTPVFTLTLQRGV